MVKTTPSRTNSQLAQAVISGECQYVVAQDLKHATAIRVAGHRLGRVLTVNSETLRVSLSDAKITHREKLSPGKKTNHERGKLQRKRALELV